MRGMGFEAGARYAPGGRLGRGLVALCASGTVAVSLGVGVAHASTITVGSPLTGSWEPGAYTGGALTIFNTSLPAGAHVTSPATGTIVAWHVTDASGGPFFLVVLNPNGNGTYTAIRLSTGGSPATTATQTYSTDLPIKAGQIVGLNNSSSNDTVGVSTSASGQYAFFSPPLTAGGSGTPTIGDGDYVLGFNAEVRPLPTIKSLSSHSGSRTGGKRITIKGKNFDGTKAVKFGSTKAKRFKVLSDTKIRAVTPRHGTGTVHVTVFNPGKSAKSQASKFKFKS